MTTTKIISTVSALLVALLAVGAFILSYDALRHVALDYGIAASLVYVWPLLIDFALVVFSLAVLRANLRGEPAWWPWFLVAIFTGATIGFNLIHANGNVVPDYLTRYLVAIVAPVALLLSFETLMTMLKGEITYHGVVTRLADLRQQIDTELRQLDAIQGDIAGRQSDLAALWQEIEARQSDLSTLRQEIAARQNEHATLRQHLDAEQGQLDALRGDIAARQNELAALRPQTDAASDSLTPPPATPAADSGDSRRDKTAERQQQILALLNRGLSSTDIATELDVSLRTVQRDIKQLNGQVNQ